jgi:hypothetical protein
MKLTLPNISDKNRLSKDYRLAYGNLNNYLESVEEAAPPRSRFLAKRSFLHRNVPHYDEYFSPDKYDHVVTNENRQLISQLNQFVDQINECREKEIYDYKTLSALRDALDDIIT